MGSWTFRVEHRFEHRHSTAGVDTLTSSLNVGPHPHPRWPCQILGWLREGENWEKPDSGLRCGLFLTLVYTLENILQHIRQPWKLGPSCEHPPTHTVREHSEQSLSLSLSLPFSVPASLPLPLPPLLFPPALRRGQMPETHQLPARKRQL